ncbi:hypothetical protein HJFPF1_10822 [Paramyrothecium foliicola]|nr:hypothetical protein HJFPF1_10822 [Paramyrothecium foliicola]
MTRLHSPPSSSQEGFPVVKMLFPKALTFVPAIFVSVNAVAVPVENQGAEIIARRATVVMTAYEHAAFKPPSRDFEVEIQTQCYRLTGTPFSENISSIKVPTGHRCRLWSNNNCTGDSNGDIYAPGAEGLGSMNDRAKSFKCYKN